MNTTIDTTMDTVATSTADFIDFDLIKADLTDVLNYVKETKPENLDKEALKALRDNLSQLETILTNAIGDKPKTEKKTAKKAEVKTFRDAEGKAFYDNLKVGDTFQYVMANGTIITAKKVETKSKSGLTAACEVISGMEIAEGKTARRYPKFNKLVKVQNTEKPVQNTEKPVENTEKPVEETEKPVEETAKTDEVKQPIAEEIKQAASVETNFNDTEIDDGDSLDFDINDLDKDFDIE